MAKKPKEMWELLLCCFVLLWAGISIILAFLGILTEPRGDGILFPLFALSAVLGSWLFLFLFDLLG